MTANDKRSPPLNKEVKRFTKPTFPISWNWFTLLAVKAVATGNIRESGPQNFIVPKTNCFKHTTKTKIIPPKMYSILPPKP